MRPNADSLFARLISPKPRRKTIPLHLSRAYLRVQVADPRLMLLSPLPADLEHPGHPLHCLPFPRAHLVRVHPVALRDPLNHALFAQRLKRRHPLLEFRRESTPLLSHFCVSFFLWSTPWQPVQKCRAPSTNRNSNPTHVRTATVVRSFGCGFHKPVSVV